MTLEKLLQDQVKRPIQALSAGYQHQCTELPADLKLHTCFSQVVKSNELKKIEVDQFRSFLWIFFSSYLSK